MSERSSHASGTGLEIQTFLEDIPAQDSDESDVALLRHGEGAAPLRGRSGWQLIVSRSERRVDDFTDELKSHQSSVHGSADLMFHQCDFHISRGHQVGVDVREGCNHKVNRAVNLQSRTRDMVVINATTMSVSE
jgi:hypothetical protein